MIERQTSQSAPLYAAKRAIEIVEHSLAHQDIKTLVIKTHSQYLVDGLSKHVFRWEENDYANADGETVANRSLFEKLHDMASDSYPEVRVYYSTPLPNI